MMTEEEASEKTELQTKKLMTVCRSKYYMLKVNYPDLAELIDNEFELVPEVEEEPAAQHVQP